MIDKTLFGNARIERYRKHTRRIERSESQQVIKEKIRSAEFREGMKPNNQ